MQFLNILIMGIDVYTLATEYPDVSIHVKVKDLAEAARIFAKELVDLTGSKVMYGPETLLTKREVMELLGVGETTLWRWDVKCDYLHPVMVGAERRWRWKDISALIEGSVTDYYGKPVWSSGNNSTPVMEGR